MRKPDFIIIGCQKAGTTWLWGMLDQHPDTDLPNKKEIHYFGGSEMHAKGRDWYYDYFRDLDDTKITGEASTTYYYDYVPYWHNESSKIEFDDSLPPIPEMIKEEMPDVKIIISLRDPVDRAISAYHHWLKKNSDLSPFWGLKKTAQELPKMRILEYGFYAKYLEFWLKYFDKENIHVSIFEEDVIKNPDAAIRELYSFLELDTDFQPSQVRDRKNKSWTWTRVVARYGMKKIPVLAENQRLGRFIDRHDILKNKSIKKEDIEFLRSHYLPEKEKLESLLSRKLDIWSYGEKYL